MVVTDSLVTEQNGKSEFKRIFIITCPIEITVVMLYRHIRGFQSQTKIVCQLHPKLPTQTECRVISFKRISKARCRLFQSAKLIASQKIQSEVRIPVIMTLEAERIEKEVEIKSVCSNHIFYRLPTQCAIFPIGIRHMNT